MCELFRLQECEFEMPVCTWHYNVSATLEKLLTALQHRRIIRKRQLGQAMYRKASPRWRVNTFASALGCECINSQSVPMCSQKRSPRSYLCMLSMNWWHIMTMSSKKKLVGRICKMVPTDGLTLPAC